MPEVNKIIKGDALAVLKTLPDNFIDCLITSPPYFNLRDYQVEGQLGLEKTWQEYIKKMIDIFTEAKRVLKKEGTCFVNLGDSYGAGTRKTTVVDSIKKGVNKGNNKGTPIDVRAQGYEKSLMMIPERFAISMIDKGWILRNKLVWVKPNAMPESVDDRWKKAHEYIFFFTKSKHYNFNLDAIRTKHKQVSLDRAEYEQGRNALGINPSSMGEKYNRDKKNKDGTEKYYSMPSRMVKLNPLGACPPDYLMVNTNCSQGDTSDHYATYPKDLITPLIKAGCPVKGLVYDPFMGSGTTAVVARYLSRDYLGSELSEEYIKICEKRLSQNVLL